MSLDQLIVLYVYNPGTVKINSSDKQVTNQIYSGKTQTPLLFARTYRTITREAEDDTL